MSRRSNGWGVILGAACAALLAMTLARPALAHISLEEGGTHKSRYGDGQLKSGPCGMAGGTRGTNIYTYAPGQKITVSLVETIVHPSYFRFAFDNDGDDAFIEPASIMPIDPARKCPDGPGDHCGASDFYNSPAVLPNMDNLNPHITATANMKYTWEVTLPDVECTNCTLQVIQVMEDDLAHGPYDPTPGVGVEDIYHQCIDLVLTRSADGGTGGSNDAGAADGRTTDAGGGATDANRPIDAATGIDSGARDGGGSTTPDAGSGSGGSTGTGGTGTGTGGTGTGGTGTGGTGTGGTGGGSAGAGSGGSAGATAGTSGGSGSGDSNGCNCSVVGAPRSAGSGAAAACSLLALALASRRRRR